MMPNCDELIAAADAYNKAFTGGNHITAMLAALNAAEKNRPNLDPPENLLKFIMDEDQREIDTYQPQSNIAFDIKKS